MFLKSYCVCYSGDNGGWSSGTFCHVLEVIHSLNQPVQIDIAQMRSNSQTSVYTNAFRDSCGCQTLLCRFTILNALFIVVVIFPNTCRLIILFWFIISLKWFSNWVPKLLTDFSLQTLTNWTHSFMCFRQSNVPLGLVLGINVELLVLTSGRQCGPVLLFNHTEILFDWAEMFYIPYVVTECVRISSDCTVNVILPVGLFLCVVTLRGEFASGKYKMCL